LFDPEGHHLLDAFLREFLMAVSVEEFFEDFDELTSTATYALYRDFPRIMRQWFNLFEDAPPAIADRVAWLRTLAPWGDVEAKVLSGPTGMVGSGTMSWPDDREERLSGQLNLFAQFASGNVTAEDFAFDYYFSGNNNINDTLHELTGHLFQPFASELRKYLVRNIDQPVPTGDEITVPASDRLVSIDHNSAPYKEFEIVLAEVEKELAASNIVSPEDRERIGAELKAGKALLDASTVRVGALSAVLLAALTWLVLQVAGSAVEMAAQSAIGWLLKLVPGLG
jgi:hypothetical protein